MCRVPGVWKMCVSLCVCVPRGCVSCAWVWGLVACCMGGGAEGAACHWSKLFLPRKFLRLMCALQAPHNTYNGIETADSTRGSRFQDSPAGGRCSPGRGAPCARIAARPRVSAPRSRVSSGTGSFGAPPLAACEASRRAPGEEGGLLTGSAAALGGAGSLAQQPPAAMPSMPLRALQVGHACLDGGLHTRERLVSRGRL